MRLAALFFGPLAPVAVLSQAAPQAPVDWTTILAAYGVAAPLVIYIIRDNGKKEARIAQVEQRNQELTDAAIDRIVPLQMQTIEVLKETKDELKSSASERERATVMMHQMSGRIDARTLHRIQQLLERLHGKE